MSNHNEMIILSKKYQNNYAYEINLDLKGAEAYGSKVYFKIKKICTTSIFIIQKYNIWKEKFQPTIYTLKWNCLALSNF